MSVSGINSVTFIGLVHENHLSLTVYDMLRKLKDTEGILQTITPEYFYFSSPNTHRVTYIQYSYHNITEILLKVAFNTINLNLYTILQFFFTRQFGCEEIN